MKPDAIERVECNHHQFCVQIDGFHGCNRCRQFVYSRDDWLRNQVEKTKNGLIVPYDYDIFFNRRVSLFTISKEGPP